MKTITVYNQKGGAGKTTSVLSIGSVLAAKGYRVLLIDYDGQASLSRAFKVRDNAEHTIAEVVDGSCSASDAVIEFENGCSIIPTDGGLGDANAKKYNALAEALKTLSNRFDFCLIDCPPAAGKLGVSAIYAADMVLLTSQANVIDFDGLEQSLNTIQLLKSDLKRKLIIGGIIPTRYKRTKFNLMLLDAFKQIADGNGTKVLPAVRECIALQEAYALAHGDIINYAPKSNAAIDYKAITDAVLEQF